MLSVGFSGCPLLQPYRDAQVFVTSKPGAVVAPEAVMQVADEGMPVAGHTQVKGVLFVQFEIKFPERLEITDGEGGVPWKRLITNLFQEVCGPSLAAMKKVLAGILPPPVTATPKLGAGMVPGVLEEADMEARKARERLAKDAYDSDEEGGGRGGGAQRVQCAQQ